MADNAQLITALRVNMDEFEKQMARAGKIADDAVANIEQSFAKANPAFGGTFLGSLLGTAAGSLLSQFVSLLQSLPSLFNQVRDAAASAGMTMEQVFALGIAIGDVEGMAQALQKLAVQVEKMRQGNADQPLFKIFEANGIQNVRTVEGSLEGIARLMERATAVQRIMLADAAGISREWIPFLSKGAVHLKENAEAARETARYLAQMADEARRFDSILGQAGRTLRTWFLGQFDSLFTDMANAIESVAAAMEKLASFKIAQWTGIAPPQEAIDQVRAMAAAVREFGKARQEAAGEPEGPGIKLPQGGGGKGVFKSEEERIRRQIALMDAETQTIGMNTAARERMRVETLLLQRAQEAGVPITEALRASVRGLAEEYAAAAVRAERARTIMEATREFGSAISEAFKAAVIEGKKLDEVLQNLIKRLSSRAMDAAFDVLFRALGGSVAGFNPLAGAFSFGGGRQHGGPVSPGTAYTVGERGPELFVPSTAGSIRPSGGMTLNYAPVIDARGADANAVARLEAVMMEQQRQLPARVVAYVNEARRRSVRV